MEEKKDRVVVLSRVYSNGLAVARSLGAAGYGVNYVASADRRKANNIIKQCRYINRFREVVTDKVLGENDERDLIEAIMRFARKKTGIKRVLFPTDDFSVSVMDANREELSRYFIMPSVKDGKPGDLLRLQDKTVQLRMAEEAGLNVAYTAKISLRDEEITLPGDIPYPCFVKPIRSIAGYKTEMKKCDDEKELREHLAVMRSSQSDRDVIVQEYLEIEYEYASAGVCLDQTVILPALIKKDLVGKHGRGVTLTGELVPLDAIGEENRKNAIKLLQSFHYTGNFGMEFAVANGKVYYNETNLRSAGESYAYFKSGYNLPAIFANYALYGEMPDENMEFTGIGKTLMYEKIAWDDYIYGNMTREELDRIIEETDLKILFDDEDPGPGDYFIRKQDRAIRRKQQRLDRCIEAVMEHTGKDREEAFRLIEEARESTGISYKDYRLLRFWDVPESSQQEEYVRRKKAAMETNKAAILSSHDADGLGVVRALGEKGYEIDYYRMLRRRSKDQMTALSKYISSYHDTRASFGASGEDGAVVEMLMETDDDKAETIERPVLIPIDEYAVLVAYTNKEELEDRFVLPFEQDLEEMDIEKVMSRSGILELAAEKGLKVPEYKVITLDDDITVPEGVTYPCILKPDKKFATGKKWLRLCKSEEDLLFNLKSFKTRYGFEDIIIQDFIEYDYEAELTGIRADYKVISPAVIKKTAAASYNAGETLVGAIESAEFLKDEIKIIRGILRKLGYTGFFNAEFFIRGDEVLFNEINFECGTGTYALNKSGVNLPDLLIKRITKRTYDDAETKVTEFGKTFVNEDAVWKEYSRNKLTKKEFKELLEPKDITLIQNEADPEPYRIVDEKKDRMIQRRRRSIKKGYKKALKPYIGEATLALRGYPQGRRKNKRDPESELPRIMVAGRNWCSNLCMAKAMDAGGYEAEVLHVWQKVPGRLNLQRYVKPEKHSDRVKAYYLCDSRRNSVRIVERLKQLADENNKMLLVPVDDLVAYAIDEYYDELKDLYILPNIEGRGGEIRKLMSKEVQKELAIKAGLPVVGGVTYKYEGGEIKIPESVKYPCFIKPNVSRNSFKTTMMKCENEEELLAVLNERKAKGFDILIEDYIEIKRELSYLGVSTEDGVICPGYFEAVIEGADSHRGVALLGRLLPTEQAEPLISEVVKFIESLHYNGLFDVDLVEDVNGTVYFVEINMRFGGSGYAVTKAGVNLPAMYADYMIKGIVPDPNCKLENTGLKFVNEKVLVDEYIDGVIDDKDVKHAMEEADIHFLKDDFDMRPYRHLKRNFMTVRRLREEKRLRRLEMEAADQE